MFKLTAPPKPRATNWEKIAEAAIHSAINLAERGVIDGEDRHRIADAIAHRILRKETNSTTDGGALVDRQPFGGARMSGVGTKAGGPDYLLHFMDPRVVTENTMRRGFAPIEADDDWVV